MKKYILGAVCLGGLVFLSSCSTSVMDIDGSSNGTVVVNPRNSPVDVKVLNTRTRFVNDMLQVSLEIESGISNTYNLEYKFFWFDASGMPVDASTTAWQPLYLYGRETKAIQGLAPNPSARSFKIELREANYN